MNRSIAGARATNAAETDAINEAIEYVEGEFASVAITKKKKRLNEYSPEEACMMSIAFKSGIEKACTLVCMLIYWGMQPLIDKKLQEHIGMFDYKVVTGERKGLKCESSFKRAYPPESQYDERFFNGMSEVETIVFEEIFLCFGYYEPHKSGLSTWGLLHAGYAISRYYSEHLAARYGLSTEETKMRFRVKEAYDALCEDGINKPRVPDILRWLKGHGFMTKKSHRSRYTAPRIEDILMSLDRTMFSVEDENVAEVPCEERGISDLLDKEEIRNLKEKLLMSSPEWLKIPMNSVLQVLMECNVEDLDKKRKFVTLCAEHYIKAAKRHDLTLEEAREDIKNCIADIRARYSGDSRTLVERIMNTPESNVVFIRIRPEEIQTGLFRELKVENGGFVERCS